MAASNWEAQQDIDVDNGNQMDDKAWRPQSGEWERDCGCGCFVCSEGIGHCDEGDLCRIVPAATSGQPPTPTGIPIGPEGAS